MKVLKQTTFFLPGVDAKLIKLKGYFDPSSKDLIPFIELRQLRKLIRHSDPLSLVLEGDTLLFRGIDPLTNQLVSPGEADIIESRILETEKGKLKLWNVSNDWTWSRMIE